MSDIASPAPTLALPPRQGWLARRKTQLARIFAAIELAVEVQRERRMLRGLDARALKDLGLNGRADAEADRPFWDLPRDRLCS
jgi:uncharacterized protein YjiS (DUF1127 family)